MRLRSYKWGTTLETKVDFPGNIKKQTACGWQSKTSPKTVPFSTPSFLLLSYPRKQTPPLMLTKPFSLLKQKRSQPSFCFFHSLATNPNLSFSFHFFLITPVPTLCPYVSKLFIARMVGGSPREQHAVSSGYG